MQGTGLCPAYGHYHLKFGRRSLYGTTEGAYEYASKKCEDDYRRNDRIIGWTIIAFATLAFVGLALLPFLKSIGVITGG